MGAALTTTAAENNRIHIPPELVQEILLKLPQKSLFRFSSVSKSWNSMIHGSNFVTRYRGRELVVLKFEQFGILRDGLICPNYLSSCNPLRDATPLACPFKNRLPFLHATCNELWCVEVEGSMFLWNPSMQTYRKLPDPSLPPWPRRYMYEFSYGLGYDSVNDDYKMLKVHKTGEAELYSLRSNSWREIPHRAHHFVKGGLHWNFSRIIVSWSNKSIQAYGENAFQEYHLKMGVFVAGALHWMVVPEASCSSDSLGQVKLISFDLSTEKYGELRLPELDVVARRSQGEMTVLKGMLCLCVNFWRDRFVLWIMEDYGVVESWTKKLDIDFNSYPCLGLTPMLRPFYFDDNGEILINVCLNHVYVSKFLGFLVEEKEDDSKIFVCKVDEQTLVEKDFRRCSRPISDSFVYVESLVLPAWWPEVVSMKREDSISDAQLLRFSFRTFIILIIFIALLIFAMFS